MAMTINTNIVSINAQRNLGLSGNSLSTTMQRLSSGLRVNSAKDDAAGLAIAERMNTQVRGLAVAARNSNDGISLAQTAEGALGKMGDMLQRMRELAVQSSNATNSAADREALQSEVSQLRAEIDRVAKTTTFNGQKILDGSFAGGVFQVGAGAGDNITVGNITNAKASNLGSAEYGFANVSVDTSSATAMTDLSAIGVNTLKIVVGSESYDLGAIAKANSSQERTGQLVSAINAKTADTGVTAFLNKQSDGSLSIDLRSSNVKEQDVVDPLTNLVTGKETVAVSVALTGFTTERTGMDAPAINTTLEPKNGAGYSDYQGLLQAEITGALRSGATSVTVGVLGPNTTFAQAESARDAAIAAVNNNNTQAFNTEVATYQTASSAGLGGVTGAVFTRDAATGNVTVTTAPTSGSEATLVALAASFGITAAYSSGYTLGGVATTAQGVVDQIVIAARGATIDAANGWSGDKQDFGDFARAARPVASAPLTANDVEAPKTEDAPFLASAFDITGVVAAARQLSGKADATLEDVLGAAGAALVDDANPSALVWQGTYAQAVTAFGAAQSLVSSNSVLGINATDVEDGLSLDGVSISTQADAWAALKTIDSAIDQVNSARADLGALQTRFEKAIENIDIQNENITAARGRIVDADFASETAALSRSQILQQAGTAMVAQANQLPQNVLSLLR